MTAPPSAGQTWIEVTVLTSTEAAEAVGAILQDLRTGGLVEDRPARPRSSTPLVRFRCYLPPSRVLPVTLRALRGRIRDLARYGLDPGPARVSRRSVAARRWATAWRGHVHPVQVGRVIVRPSWIRVPERPGVTVITIDPGMAFGTGLHPTTRLCLQALLQYLPPRPPRPSGIPRPDSAVAVFDIGTGSGILAIAAARLGAARVWAVDNDPVAVAVARENTRLNGVTRLVRVVRGTGVGRAPGRAGLILANLIAEAIVPMLPAVRNHLTPRGVFVGSGIIADRLPAVTRAGKAAGLRRIRILSDGEWRALVLSAPDAPGRSRRPLQTSRNRVE